MEPPVPLQAVRPSAAVAIRPATTAVRLRRSVLRCDMVGVPLVVGWAAFRRTTNLPRATVDPLTVG
ncbi:hypothetical protein GCM10010341_05980 [Streptomyces noursei]|nr:hypothetical protein GCM10010341_05980 [Streptomyces noursei]